MIAIARVPGSQDRRRKPSGSFSTPLRTRPFDA
jgi:hypothetical protein